MMDFKSLQVARSQSSETRGVKSVSAYDEAREILIKFKINPNITFLESAANKLVKSLEFNKEHAQSYFLLSYIFYALDDYPLAFKYFKKGESFRTEIPIQLSQFKKKIVDSLEKKYQDQVSPDSSPENVLENVTVPVPVRAIVSKPSSFWKRFTL